MFMSESPQTCPTPYGSPWRICFDLFQTAAQRDGGLGRCPGVPALWYSPSFSQKDLQVLALCLDDEQPARSVVCEDKDEKEGSINTLALMGHVLCCRVCLPYSGSTASIHLWRHFRKVRSSLQCVTKTVIIQLDTFSKAKDSQMEDSIVFLASNVINFAGRLQRIPLWKKYTQLEK